MIKLTLLTLLCFSVAQAEENVDGKAGDLIRSFINLGKSFAGVSQDSIDHREALDEWLAGALQRKDSKGKKEITND